MHRIGPGPPHVDGQQPDADEKLTATANLLALEPYGHGQTRASYEQFTYWDSAVTNLQVGV